MDARELATFQNHLQVVHLFLGKARRAPETIYSVTCSADRGVLQAVAAARDPAKPSDNTGRDDVELVATAPWSLTNDELNNTPFFPEERVANAATAAVVAVQKNYLSVSRPPRARLTAEPATLVPFYERLGFVAADPQRSVNVLTLRPETAQEVVRRWDGGEWPAGGAGCAPCRR